MANINNMSISGGEFLVTETETTTKTKEFDSKGKVVKETNVTERVRTYRPRYDYTPYTPYSPTWTTSGGTDVNLKYGLHGNSGSVD